MCNYTLIHKPYASTLAVYVLGMCFFVVRVCLLHGYYYSGITAAFSLRDRPCLYSDTVATVTVCWYIVAIVRACTHCLCVCVCLLFLTNFSAVLQTAYDITLAWPPPVGRAAFNKQQPTRAAQPALGLRSRQGEKSMRLILIVCTVKWRQKRKDSKHEVHIGTNTA